MIKQCPLPHPLATPPDHAPWPDRSKSASYGPVLSAVLDPCFKPLKFLSEEKLEAVKIELRELKAFLLYLLIMMLRASTKEEVQVCI